MSLFSKKSVSSGLMDEIRCDEPSYLIWKWHPRESEAGNNKRENAIRWGSSLRVKDGEAAVFVYKQPTGVVQDIIEGPFDGILETNNLPLIANIIGLAYGGGTPFPAEVYYVNLSRIVQVPFGVPYFDIYDPRFLDFGVPTAVRGTLTFNIANVEEFIKLHRLTNFDLNEFQKQIRDAMIRYVKSIVANIPEESNIPVVQIERKISFINELVEAAVKLRLERDFGVNVTGVDISAIEIDKTSEGYQQLKEVTQDITSATMKAQMEVNIKDMKDTQKLSVLERAGRMAVNIKEDGYARHKQTQSANFAAYQTEAQENVGVAGAEGLGKMGSGGGSNIGGGMNPGAIMAGMAMGSAIGQNMAGTMNGMMTGLNTPPQPGAVPPPVPTMAYHVVLNGQSSGPFDMSALSKMVSEGSLTKETLVWKQGMGDWVKAESVQELGGLFPPTVPPVPPVPPVPGQ